MVYTTVVQLYYKYLVTAVHMALATKHGSLKNHFCFMHC